MKKLETKLRLFMETAQKELQLQSLCREDAKVFLFGRTLTNLSS